MRRSSDALLFSQTCVQVTVPSVGSIVYTQVQSRYGVLFACSLISMLVKVKYSTTAVIGLIPPSPVGLYSFKLTTSVSGGPPVPVPYSEASFSFTAKKARRR